MPLHGLVHDSPIITLVQKSTKGHTVRRDASRNTFTIFFGRLIVKLIYAIINLVKKIKNR
jgi:hypothetical protein